MILINNVIIQIKVYFNYSTCKAPKFVSIFFEYHFPFFDFQWYPSKNYEKWLKSIKTKN